jgi:UDP:flavonoid glycosyltransferase YjiC (YdhE family)
MSVPRYLFVTWEGGGNVPPVLGAARRLVARGCDVRILTEPCLREAVEGIGARFVPFTAWFVRTDARQPLLTDWRTRFPPAALAISMRDVVLGPAPIVAADVSRVLDEEDADALVVDWLMPGAVAVGEARNLPTAVLLHCVNMLPAPGRPGGPAAPATGPLGRLRDRLLWGAFRLLANQHRPAFNAMRGQLGLPPLVGVLAQYDSARRILVQTTRTFDFVGDPDPDNLVYVGPVLDMPWGMEEAWTSPWPADDPRPLVLLSLSTTFQDQQAILQSAIEALGRLSVRALVTLGPAMTGCAFTLPDNVVAVASAPHDAILPLASVAVTHCGHGSTIRALAHGVPLVALPMGRDQDGTARRIVYHGLGLAPGHRPTAIARAVQTVLDEPRYRTAALAMAQHIRRDVEADTLTTELLGLVTPGQRASP